MKEIRWRLYNSSWLIAFVILMAWVMRIPLIGVAFLPLLFLFVWFFSTTVKKFGNSWLLWLIPYTFSSIFYLWIFVGGNPLSFVFADFWLSLSKWFTLPLSPFGMATILFAILYVVSYFVAHNLRRTLNTSLALVVVSAIAGMASQYDNLIAAFGFVILLISALFLNAKYNDKRMSKTVLLFIATAILVSVLLFSVGTIFKPFTPIGDLFTFNHLTTSSVSTPIHRVVKNGITGVPAGSVRPHFRSSMPAISRIPTWIYDVIIDTIGIIVAIIGVLLLIGRILSKEKVKMPEVKTFIFVIWAVASGVFLLFLFMYMSKLINHRSLSRGAALSQQFGSQPRIAHEATQTLPSSPMKNFIPYVKNPIHFLWNPIVLSALVIIGAVIIVYVIFEILKAARPSGYEEEKLGENEKVSVYESENIMNYDGNPRETVLFYYGVLRAKVGDPSMTPHEFGNWLKEKIGRQESGTLTKIFVKLRYAHRKITQKEADFVKKFVREILSQK